jgi:tetratricopeptide (TPR) repeat protein
LGRVDEALAVQRALEQNGDGMYVYEEIAECLLLLKREAEARPYFAKAYEMLSKDPWLAENESARLERLKESGQV